jgi:hypothetical protein
MSDPCAAGSASAQGDEGRRGVRLSCGCSSHSPVGSPERPDHQYIPIETLTVSPEAAGWQSVASPRLFQTIGFIELSAPPPRAGSLSQLRS